MLSLTVFLFACGDSPPAQEAIAVSNPIAIQKVQPVAAAESKISLEAGGAKSDLQPAGAPEKQSNALPIGAEPVKAVDQPVTESEMTTTPVEQKTGTSAPLSMDESTAVLKLADTSIETENASMEAVPLHVEGVATVAPAQIINESEMAAEVSDVIKESLQVVGSYDPQDRFDPFEPLFRAQSEEQTAISKSTRDKRAPQTPLEQVALSQLKVTAIIRSAAGNRALVEDATGKGYVVQRGTYIGLNAGRVTEIDKGRIVVEEEIENIMGGLTLQNAELKLQKPAGEL